MYQHILHPTDLSENHFKLCEQALTIAKHFNAQLYLMHVIEPPPTFQLAQSLGFAEFEPPLRNAKAVMEVLGEAMNIPINRQFVAVGSIKKHVLDKVKELGCELIIIGSHHTTALPMFLGSTAHAVVNHAQCDVLTIRTFD